MKTTEESYPPPYIINFSSFGESSWGHISVAEQNKDIPFEIKRVFWTYFTPESIVRGRHAHIDTQQVLVAAAGRIIVTTEAGDGTLHNFVLERPDYGVYIPPNVWHTMQYSHSAVQLVMASELYNVSDYIRDYLEFKKVYGK